MGKFTPIENGNSGDAIDLIEDYVRREYRKEKLEIDKDKSKKQIIVTVYNKSEGWIYDNVGKDVLELMDLYDYNENRLTIEFVGDDDEIGILFDTSGYD